MSTKLNFNKQVSGFSRVNRMQRENCDALIATIKNIYYANAKIMPVSYAQELLEMLTNIERHQNFLPAHERDEMYTRIRTIRKRCMDLRNTR